MNIIKQIKQIPSRLRSLNNATEDIVVFDLGDGEVTLREMIASLVIVSFMLILGVLISDKISDKITDKNRKYDQAIQITDTDMFQYGMDTSVGNAFVYGDIEPVDTVTFPDIGGEYLWIRKVEEHYNMHTRTVTHSNGKGGTYTTTETYWTWDYYDSEEKSCENIIFCGVKLPFDKFKGIDDEYIDTLSGGYHVRFIYTGIATNHTGTIYTQLKDGTISDGSKFMDDKTIEESLESMKTMSNLPLIIFWLIWIALTIAAVIGFYMIDNSWLE